MVSAGALTFGGCRSPLARQGDDLLLRSVDAAIARELAGEAEEGVDRVTYRPPSAVEEQLRPRREELDALGPQFQAPADELLMMLGPDLAGQPQRQAQQLNANPFCGERGLFLKPKER